MIDIQIFTQAGFNKVNEDYICHAELTPGVYAVAVADGMGGLSFGDIAAKMTAESIVSYLKESGNDRPIEYRIANGIISANDSIGRECEHRKTRMGASIAVAVINENVCHYSSLGNVRIYILRNNKLTLLTEDHTNSIAGQSYLSRCVNGRTFRHKVAVRAVELLNGDEIIMATDGYYIHNDLTSDGYHKIVDDDASVIKISIELNT